MEFVKTFCPVNQVQQMYRDKLTTADEAVKCIKSGDRVH